jgi:hypothetical protein
MNTQSLARHLRRFSMILAGAAIACGPFRRGTVPEPAVVIFTNQALDQAAVYVVAAGSDYRRIGTVMPGRTETLEVPSDLATRSTVNIIARLLAHSSFPQTGYVSLSPGERYEVTLPPDGRMLSFLPARQ